MSDTISKQTAIDVAFDIYPDDEYFREQFVKRIMALPSAQPERKKGKWIPKPDEKFHCNKCDGIAPKGYRWDFCPHCGADMRGEQ